MKIAVDRIVLFIIIGNLRQISDSRCKYINFSNTPQILRLEKFHRISQETNRKVENQEKTTEVVNSQIIDDTLQNGLKLSDIIKRYVDKPIGTVVRGWRNNILYRELATPKSNGSYMMTGRIDIAMK